MIAHPLFKPASEENIRIRGEVLGYKYLLRTSMTTDEVREFMSSHKARGYNIRKPKDFIGVGVYNHQYYKIGNITGIRQTDVSLIFEFKVANWIDFDMYSNGYEGFKIGFP